MGGMNEGVLFGGLCALVFLFVFGIEFVRARRETVKALRREQYVQACTWAIFLLLVGSCWVRNPIDNDPSIFITVAAGLNLFAQALLFLAPRRDGEISERTTELAGSQDARAPGEFGLLLCVSFVIRFAVTMRWNGYLPSDQTGDGCIQGVELLTAAIVFYATVIRDRTLSKTVFLRFIGGVACAVVLAYFVYGGLDRNVHADRAYAVTVYCELFAWCFMLNYVINHVQEYANSMYLLPSLVASCSQCYCWIAVIQENTAYIMKAQGWFSVVLVAVQFAQCVIFASMMSMTIKKLEVSACIPSWGSESWNVLAKVV